MGQGQSILEFCRWFYHELIDYFSCRQRARLVAASPVAGPTRGGAVAQGSWQPLERCKRQAPSFDWSPLAALRQVDRKVLEIGAACLVLFPLMGYYFSVAVPAVQKFWLGR